MIWRCFICYIFVALTLKKLLSHINSLHSRSPDFRVVCGIDGCPSEYRVYNSYYYHIKRTHAHHLLQVEGAEEEGSTHNASSGTRESTTTNNQTNVSSVAAVRVTQQLSSEAEEGSSIVRNTVRLSLWFLAKLVLDFVVVIATNANILPVIIDMLICFSVDFKKEERVMSMLTFPNMQLHFFFKLEKPIDLHR